MEKSCQKWRFGERGDLRPLFILWAWHRVWHRLYPCTILPLFRCSTFFCFYLHLWLRPHLPLLFSSPLCYASYCVFLEGVANTLFFPSFPCCFFALIDITLASFYFWSIFIYPIFWNHCRLPTKQSIRAWFERGDLGPLFIPWAWHRVWHRLYPCTILPLSRCSTFLCFSLHLWLRPHLPLLFSSPLCYASYCAFSKGSQILFFHLFHAASLHLLI